MDWLPTPGTGGFVVSFILGAGILWTVAPWLIEKLLGRRDVE